MGEGMLDRSECSKALKNMNNGKSPGMDHGTLQNFIKKNWNDLNEYLVNSLNYGFKKGNLSTS
jgi:hypothetical protein